MIFCTKKYFRLLLVIFLFAGYGKVEAQISDSVNIRCVSVDALGDVTLTWILPSNTSLIADGYNNYTVLASPTNIVGTYNPVATVTNPAQNSVFIPVGSLPKSPNAGKVYFYVSTNNSSTNAYNSKIDSSMFLSLVNTGGIAELSWNGIANPLYSSSSRWFRIYQSYGPSYTWNLIDSVNVNTIAGGLYNYYDTITQCKDSIDYMVQIDDSIGCTSTSNYTGATFTNSKQPSIVYMDTVSVSGSTVNVTWSLPLGRRRNVIGYIIYEYINTIWVPIDTVWGINNTTYNFTKGNPDSTGYSFLIACLDSCNQLGPQSLNQSTIFLQENPEPCAQRNTLSWNQYVNLVGSVKGYRVYVSISSGPYQLLGTTGPSTLQYIDSNLTTKELRCYIVQVVDSLRKDTTASSNMVCYYVQSSPKPAYRYLRTASVQLYNNGIFVSDYIDTLSVAMNYAFQRADTTGVYSTIYTAPAPHHFTDLVNYVDNSVDPNAESYQYRVVTLDSCNLGIDTSNIGKTVCLKAIGQADGNNVLTWNDYEGWFISPYDYLIYRSVDSINYAFVNSVNYSNAGQNTYTDNIKGTIIGQGTFYYYILARERNGFRSFYDTSFSNVAKAYQDPTVFIPNAFNPKGVNRIFKPVGVFIDVKGYDFIILNRWGIKVFETNDPNVGWDGTYAGGKKPEQEEVYVYLLTYTSSKGQYFQRKGTVTMLK